MNQETILSFNNIYKSFSIENEKKYVLKDISIDILYGECIALIGESGSGKSTFAKILMNIIQPDSGNIKVNPKIEQLHPSEKFQIVFQNIDASLNPNKNILEIIKEPLDILGKMSEHQKRDKVIEILHKVGLPEYILYKNSTQISGGQKQRVSIGRSIISYPKLLICDEPVSALDSINQKLILKLLKDIQKEFNTSILFISHDLPSVKYMSNRIAIMYDGSIVEIANTDNILKKPQHPYTKTLLQMVPKMSRVNLLSV